MAVTDNSNEGGHVVMDAKYPQVGLFRISQIDAYYPIQYISPTLCL